jgi:hypothetical protein
LDPVNFRSFLPKSGLWTIDLFFPQKKSQNFALKQPFSLGTWYPREGQGSAWMMSRKKAGLYLQALGQGASKIGISIN